MNEQDLANAIVQIGAGSALSVLQTSLRPWRGITVHHSYAPHLPEWGVNYALAFNRFHYRYRHWEKGLGYHLLLSWNPAAPEEHICWASGRWTQQWDGAHAVNRKESVLAGQHIAPNAETIGVCVVGDYSSFEVPAAVYGALTRLLQPILSALPGGEHARLFRHDQFQEKNCPGSKFDTDHLASLLHCTPFRGTGGSAA